MHLGHKRKVRGAHQKIFGQLFSDRNFSVSYFVTVTLFRSFSEVSVFFKPLRELRRPSQTTENLLCKDSKIFVS